MNGGYCGSALAHTRIHPLGMSSICSLSRVRMNWSRCKCHSRRSASCCMGQLSRLHPELAISAHHTQHKVDTLKLAVNTDRENRSDPCGLPHKLKEAYTQGFKEIGPVGGWLTSHEIRALHSLIIKPLRIPRFDEQPIKVSKTKTWCDKKYFPCQIILGNASSSGFTVSSKDCRHRHLVSRLSSGPHCWPSQHSYYPRIT